MILPYVSLIPELAALFTKTFLYDCVSMLANAQNEDWFSTQDEEMFAGKMFAGKLRISMTFLLNLNKFWVCFMETHIYV